MIFTELEKSDNIVDRQRYAKFLKDCISDTENLVKKWEEFEEGEFKEKYLKMYKESIKELKIRLSNYDVYNQKIPYKCPVCNELECVCQELNQDVKIEEIKPQEVDKLF